MGLMLESLDSPTLEDRIKNNEFYQASLPIGKERKGHPEAQLGVHISSILDFIDSHYKDSPYFKELRIIAMLHDVGKLSREEEFGETVPEDVRRNTTTLREKFIKTFPLSPEEESEFIPSHALYSEKLAKSLGITGQTLSIIRYHDSGFKFYKEAAKNEDKYDEGEFKKIFSPDNFDMELYLLFNFSDNNRRDADLTYWLQDELIKHGLIKDLVIHKPA